MTLRDAIDRVTKAEGIDRSEVIRRLEHAVLDAAREAWGRHRNLEVHFDEAEDVQIYQVVRVVETVDPSRAHSEVDLATAQERFGGELGDELLVQVFYRDEDAEAARHAQVLEVLPRFEDLAKGLPLSVGPDWMRALWPGRRRPWRWGLPVSLPSFADAMRSLEPWIRSVAPGFMDGAGSPAEHLDLARALGPAAGEVVSFYERFGPSETTSESLGLFGTSLESVPEALERRTMMTDLAAQGALGERSWSDAWLPMFGGLGGTAYCLDLEGMFNGTPGQIVTWIEDGPERTIEAPSFGAWLGLLALAADFELLHWDERDGILCSDDSQAWFDELHRYVLPGYPRVC